MSFKTPEARIFEGSLMHRRLEGAEHQFTYSVYFHRFDVDELQELGRKSPFFGYNRWNLWSIYDKDYLERGWTPLRQKVENQLQRLGMKFHPEKIELVTCARYFGYVFNPVSFFYCYTKTGEVGAVLAQVNNTFGETHLYALSEPESADQDWLPGEGAPPPRRIRFRTKKEFHVSPFFDRKGDYEFLLSSERERVHISVNLYKEGKPSIVSDWRGTAFPFTPWNLIRIFLKFPFSALLTLPRIHWHAARLYFEKKRNVYSKPAAEHPLTLRKAKRTWLQSISRDLIISFFKKIRKGILRVESPEGEVLAFGGEISGQEAVIKIYENKFFWRLVKDSGIGLGESYMLGEWDSPDVTKVLQLLVENKPYLEKKKASFFKGFGDGLNRLRHLGRHNSILNSKKNIQEHYDLGNDFFELFLDPSMTYSSGIFLNSQDTLEQAQKQKIQRMIEKADIQKDHHVLEIGCGWGAFALQAVRQTGCRWTGITLSEEQLRYAEEKVKEAGLQDKIQFKLCDYRHVEGVFDRIVSVEMLEAVGHKYYGDFFKACRRLLTPEGRVAIQVISIPHERYESYRQGCDFIQKHIFPGGHLPSREVLEDSAWKHGRLRLIEADDIGPHYARTLRLWRETFNARSRELDALKFSRTFQRMWQYYFHYCEAGFASRYLQNLQFVLTPANEEPFKKVEEQDGSQRVFAQAGH